MINRLTDITDSLDVNIAHLAFDELSRRTGLTFANGISTSYSYDLASRLLSLVTSPMPQVTSYTYDSVGNRQTMTDTLGIHNYGYDDLYRLTSATLPTEAYTYDPVGNRNPASFVYDAANRLLDDGVYTYTYDDNGNLTVKTNKTVPTDITNYTYDVENQLVQVTSPMPQVTSYTYDGLGRRIEKNVNGTITRYIYDNEDIIAEYDDTNTLQANYLHGPGVDEPLRMERGGQKYFYHTDGLGSITNLTDQTGATVKTYQYDAFGNIINQTGTLVNPFTYTGREYDSESGLYYYRARYYDGRIGRFLQEDPVGYLGGLNLYVYVKNNPLNFVDPWGWREEKSWWNYYLGALIQGLNEPSVISNRRFEESLINAMRYTYIDVGASFSTKGTLGPGLNIGIIVAPSGLYWYYGVGLGIGAGASATLNVGTPPSPGIDVTTTIRGGSGWGGTGSVGLGGEGCIAGGIGGGFGILGGVTVTATRTYRIISW